MLWGNTGTDTFVFLNGYGPDRIMDHKREERDRIQLDDALWAETDHPGGGQGVDVP